MTDCFSSTVIDAASSSIDFSTKKSKSSALNVAAASSNGRFPAREPLGTEDAGTSREALFGNCHGCGQPARRRRRCPSTLAISEIADKATEESEVIPLQRCSRCKNVFYHDAICQRNHFQKHRKECRPPENSQSDVLRPQQQYQQTIKTKEENLMEIPLMTSAIDYSPENRRVTLPKGVSVCEKQGRGKCLVATTEIAAGELISSLLCHHSQESTHPAESAATTATSAVSGAYSPMVPPVLVEQYRQTRCAYCFGKIVNQEEKIVLCKLNRYAVLFCSETCFIAGGVKRGGLDDDDLWSLESKAVYAMCNGAVGGTGPPKVLPMAVLMYRILLAVGWGHLKWTDVTTLHYADNWTARTAIAAPWIKLDSSYEESRLCHQQAVLMTVQALVEVTINARLSPRPQRGGRQQQVYDQRRLMLKSLANDKDLEALLSRLKLNCFTIHREMPSDGDELISFNDEAIGFGAFQHPARRINHSCRPNALQSLSVGSPGYLPSLSVKTIKTIPPGCDICISYIDVHHSKQQRQEKLWKDYGFLCQCSLCR